MTDKSFSIDEIQEKFDSLILSFFNGVRSELVQPGNQKSRNAASFDQVLVSYNEMLDAVRNLNGIESSPTAQTAELRSISDKYEDAKKRILLLEEQLKTLGCEVDSEIDKNI